MGFGIGLLKIGAAIVAAAAVAGSAGAVAAVAAAAVGLAGAVATGAAAVVGLLVVLDDEDAAVEGAVAFCSRGFFSGGVPSGGKSSF